MFLNACANENAIPNEDTNIQALEGELVCVKSAPPVCRVGDVVVKTSKAGTPEKDANGDYIPLNK